MFPYDESEVSGFRDKALAVEKEYLEIRMGLRDAEADLRADLENKECKARVRYLAWRLADLERRFPWLLSEAPSGKGSLCGVWQEGGPGEAKEPTP